MDLLDGDNCCFAVGEDGVGLFTEYDSTSTLECTIRNNVDTNENRIVMVELSKENGSSSGVISEEGRRECWLLVLPMMMVL